MPSKLTLRLDQDLIRRARHEARARGVSVSALVASFLATLPPDDESQVLTPRVRRLRGLLRGAVGDRETHRCHLIAKQQG